MNIPPIFKDTMRTQDPLEIPSLEINKMVAGTQIIHELKIGIIVKNPLTNAKTQITSNSANQKEIKVIKNFTMASSKA
jgi:hypothetical protein